MEEKIERADPDITQELDKRYRAIISTLDDAQLRMVFNFLDRLGSESSLLLQQEKEKEEGCTPESPPPTPKDKEKEKYKDKEETPPPPPRRDAYCYLYLQRNERLSRLNLTKLSDAPTFELVCDFGPSHSYPRTRVVCFNVDSKIYMVGDNVSAYPKSPPPPPPFFQVLSIDTDKSPSFLPCPAGTIADGFAAPVFFPLVVTLHGKIYVMSLLPNVGHTCFQVLDNGSWKTLPPPPFLPDVRVDCKRPFYKILTAFSTHYAWGHKIVVCLSTVLDYEHTISYCFDTKLGKWIDINHIYKDLGEDVPVLKCVAEYNNNFLIAMLFFSEDLAVYALDENGYPHFYHKLEEMFVHSHISTFPNTFIIPFDDDADKFCLIRSSDSPPNVGGKDDCLLQLVVFRMTISNLDGKKKLTAVLEAYQSYLFYKLPSSLFDPIICSAFLKRDNLNLDNLKADRSFGRACLD